MKENERYFINGIFMAMSIIYFIYLNIVGIPDGIIILLKYGGLHLKAIEGKEYWRYFVSIFIHVNMRHILCAMLCQYIIGERLERALGKIKYAILFLIVSIGSNLVFIRMEMREIVATQGVSIAVGASGVICGLAGGLLYVAQANKGKYYSLSSYKILLVLVFWVVYGLINKNISNDVNISGFIIGYLLSVILYRRPKTHEEIMWNQSREISISEYLPVDNNNNWEDLE